MEENRHGSVDDASKRSQGICQTSRQGAEESGGVHRPFPARPRRPGTAPAQAGGDHGGPQGAGREPSRRLPGGGHRAGKGRHLPDGAHRRPRQGLRVGEKQAIRNASEDRRVPTVRRPGAGERGGDGFRRAGPGRRLSAVRAGGRRTLRRRRAGTADSRSPGRRLGRSPGGTGRLSAQGLQGRSHGRGSGHDPGRIPAGNAGSRYARSRGSPGRPRGLHPRGRTAQFRPGAGGGRRTPQGHFAGVHGGVADISASLPEKARGMGDQGPHEHQRCGRDRQDGGAHAPRGVSGEKAGKPQGQGPGYHHSPPTCTSR